MVSEVIEAIRHRPVFIRVVDVSLLPAIDPKDWNTIVVMHTWEIGKPPADVKSFIDKTKNDPRIFEVATSGDGNFKMEGIDGITSASKMDNVRQCARSIVERIERDRKKMNQSIIAN